MSKTPPICGSSAKRIRRSIAKSSPVGRRRPWLIHATIRIAASVCGSRRLSDRVHGLIERLPAIDDSRLPLPTELADPTFALSVPSRHGITQCGLGRSNGRRHPRGIG